METNLPTQPNQTGRLKKSAEIRENSREKRKRRQTAIEKFNNISDHTTDVEKKETQLSGT